MSTTPNPQTSTGIVKELLDFSLHTEVCRSKGSCPRRKESTSSWFEIVIYRTLASSV